MPTRSSRRSRVRSKKGGRPRRSRVRTKKGGRPRRSRVRTKKGGWLGFRSSPQSPKGASLTTARKQAEKNNRNQRLLDAEQLNTARRNSQNRYNKDRKKDETKHKISSTLYNSLKNNPVIWNFILKNEGINNDLNEYITEIHSDDEDKIQGTEARYKEDDNERRKKMNKLKDHIRPLSKRNPFVRGYGRWSAGQSGRQNLQGKWDQKAKINKLYENPDPALMRSGYSPAPSTEKPNSRAKEPTPFGNTN